MVYRQSFLISNICIQCTETEVWKETAFAEICVFSLTINEYLVSQVHLYESSRTPQGTYSRLIVNSGLEWFQISSS
jgi:hypothetical protein